MSETVCSIMTTFREGGAELVRTDTERMAEALRQARKSIHHALKDADRPKMSVEELRQRADREMGDLRLSDFIVRQRDDRG